MPDCLLVHLNTSCYACVHLYTSGYVLVHLNTYGYVFTCGYVLVHLNMHVKLAMICCFGLVQVDLSGYAFQVCQSVGH